MAQWSKKLVKKPRGSMPINRLSNQAKGLVAFWPVFESDNTRLTDASERRATGIGTNSPTRAATPLGYGVQFNGTNQYMTMSSGITNGFATWHTTVSVRVKFNSLPGGGENSMMLQIGSDASTWGVGFELYSNNVRFNIVNQTPAADNVQGTTTLVTGKWYHLVGVHDGATLKVYVNGVLDNSKTSASTSLRTTGAGSLTLGGLNPTGGRYFNGVMEDIRVYNRALSYGEVQDLYSNPLSIFKTAQAFDSFIPQSGTTYYQTAAATSTSTATESSTQVTLYYESASATATSTATAATQKIEPPKSFTISGNGLTTGYITTNNGTSWSSVTYPTTSVYGRKWNGSYWVGVSNNSNLISKSSDGVNWTYVTYGVSTSIGCITWSPALGLWVTGWTSGAIYTSPDGTTWTSRTPATPGQNWNACAWSPSLEKFVIVGRTSAFFNYSSDGITWYESSSDNGVVNGVYNDICWTGTQFIAVDQNTTTRMLKSTDGINWTQVTVPSNNYWYVATNGSGTVVAVSDNYYACLVSFDYGDTWAARSLSVGPRRWGPGGVAYNGSYFMVAAYDDTTWYISNDGDTWTSITSCPTGHLQIESAWVPSYGTGIQYSQSAAALATSYLDKLFTFTRVKQGGAYSASVVTKKFDIANTRPVALTTNVSTSRKQTASTKSSASIEIAALLKNPSITKSTYSISTCLSNAIRAALVVASATSTSIVSSIKSIFGNRSTTSISNNTVTKAALLSKDFTATSNASKTSMFGTTKQVIGTTLSSIQKAVSISKIASSISSAFGIAEPLIKVVYQTCSTLVSSVGSLFKQGQISKLAESTTSNVIEKAMSIYISSLSIVESGKTLAVDLTQKAINGASTESSKLVDISKSVLTSSVSDLMKNVSWIRSATNTTVASIGKLFDVSKSVLVTNATNLLKTIRLSKVSLSTSLTTISKFFDVSKAAISTTISGILKSVSLTKTVVSNAITSLTARVIEMITALYSLFVTIGDGTLVNNEEIIITEKSVALDQDDTETIELAIPGTEKIIINL